MELTGYKTFDEFLTEKALLSLSDQENMQRICRDTGERPIPVIARISDIEGRVLSSAVADYYGLSLVRSEEWPSLLPFEEDLSRRFLVNNNVLPIGECDNGLILAMEDPEDNDTLEAIHLATGKEIIPKIASRGDIRAAINRLTPDQALSASWTKFEGQGVAPDNVDQLRDLALGAPIIHFVDELLTEASRARATDIHIEPFDDKLNIRIRVDGMLRHYTSPPSSMAKTIVSRIKIVSGLNIAEKRLPQDGRARVNIDGRQFDLRVATMPSVHGESVVIRLLDNVRRSLNFSSLGFRTEQEQQLRRHLDASHGLIIVTGPTGSGKTTTLATAISELNQSHRKILTIEDPIEYEIEGVNQSQIKPEIGLSFATALRSFLRHDPDVIMVGEIRDLETAQIALHAALTGHLVLTTLHTNSAASAVVRLLDMGVDAYILASTLRCVIGQRLVRLLCQNCKEMTMANSDIPENLPELVGIQIEKNTSYGHARGCDSCHGSGYRDRMALLEILNIDKNIHDLIREGISAQEIEKIACEGGMNTMIMDGILKSREGLTTPSEAIRVALGI